MELIKPYIKTKGSRERLHPGRSSSVRKLQRWHNNGDIPEYIPKLQEVGYQSTYNGIDSSTETPPG
jgi:hypothetical protein